MKRSRVFAVLAMLTVFLSACGINSIPRAEEEAKAKWANVQADYQRRANLIPNIVASVKGAAGSEKEILLGVTEARASASRVAVTGDQLTDPQAMARFAEAQNRITLQLQRLQEAYPQLQSQGNFKLLITELEGTENRIAIDIRDYNDSVQAYNTRIRTFPDVIGAKVFYGAKPIVPYQATTPGAEAAPTVDFGNSR